MSDPTPSPVSQPTTDAQTQPGNAERYANAFATGFMSSSRGLVNGLLMGALDTVAGSVKKGLRMNVNALAKATGNPELPEPSLAEYIHAEVQKSHEAAKVGPGYAISETVASAVTGLMGGAQAKGIATTVNTMAEGATATAKLVAESVITPGYIKKAEQLAGGASYDGYALLNAANKFAKSTDQMINSMAKTVPLIGFALTGASTAAANEKIKLESPPATPPKPPAPRER